MITTAIMLLFCNCVYCCKKHTKLPPKNDNLRIQLEDSVKQLLGDSVTRIVFEADSVKLIKLTITKLSDSLATNEAASEVTTPTDFHGCYIERDFGSLQRAEIYPLLFILSDKTTYMHNNLHVKAPFMPYVALSFFKSDLHIDIIFSFSGGQMYIFDGTKEPVYFKYEYERLITRFFQNLLHDEALEEFLNINN